MKRVILHDSSGEVLMLDNIYPVGSIYMSVNSTDPGTLFGGTWTRIKDTFLLSSGDTYIAGDTGGEASHTLITDEMPSHHHLAGQRNTAIKSSTSGNQWPPLIVDTTGNPSVFNQETTDVGGGKAHNNMPPYLVVYMWQRTA